VAVSTLLISLSVARTLRMTPFDAPTCSFGVFNKKSLAALMAFFRLFSNHCARRFRQTFASMLPVQRPAFFSVSLVDAYFAQAACLPAPRLAFPAVSRARLRHRNWQGFHTFSSAEACSALAAYSAMAACCIALDISPSSPWLGP